MDVQKSMYVQLTFATFGVIINVPHYIYTHKRPTRGKKKKDKRYMKKFLIIYKYKKILFIFIRRLEIFGAIVPYHTFASSGLCCTYEHKRPTSGEREKKGEKKMRSFIMYKKILIIQPTADGVAQNLGIILSTYQNSAHGIYDWYQLPTWY